MAGRGEHSEIVAFVGRSVDSELSGNMIDLCPVGALTSKPFRYARAPGSCRGASRSARTTGWAPTSSCRSRTTACMRVLPLENEAVNECWLSDKDRFSYEALNADDRLTAPMVKRDGEVARSRLADGARVRRRAACARRRAKHGGAALGALVSPHATLEEMALAAQLTRGARQPTTSISACGSPTSAATASGAGVPWLGHAGRATRRRSTACWWSASFLRKDHPLLAQRLRQAAKQGAQVSILHSVDDDLLLTVAAFARRAAVADAAGAGRDRRRGRPGRRPAGAGRR